MKKKPVTLSDKINKSFDPDAEYSDESGSDEAAPKFSEFDELPETTSSAGLSEIRKRNVKLLEDIDQKYGGAVSSRKEAFGDDEDDDYFRNDDDEDEEEDDDDDGEEEDEEDEEDDFGEEDDEEEQERHVVKKGSILRLKPPQSDDDDSGAGDSDADGSEASDDESDDEQDESFATYLQQAKAPPAPKTKLITEENRQETIGKGLAVQNQLKLWERMLEMRIKLQPCVIAANSLPSFGGSYDKFSRESKEFREKISETTTTITGALDSLLKLQEKLFDQFSETKQLLKAGSKRKALRSHSTGKRSALEEYEKCLAGRTHDMVDYRNGVLMKWYDRTKIASSARNQKQSLSVLKKIEDSLINREELVRKTQLYRGGYQRLGRPATDSGPSKVPGQSEEKQPADAREVDEDQPAEAKPVYDEEIYEDSDFYHQLLRELIEYKTNTTDSPQEIANKLAELQKLRNKMKKNVDTKATKGRKIRYVVHKKLVNFMAPVPDYDWTDEAKDELFGSLFGKVPTTATE
uniref:Putative apoptosis antagonizing transcription factor/protein transport protein n=1 Tax=Anopheles triannulatus TaxID=58253 RepID=A0A2M4AJH3_9DIPT